MPIVRYLTHPQVDVDPAVPVPGWGLSPLGRARTERLAEAGWLEGTRHIVASTEVKATETAGILADALGVTYTTRADMGENDRSSTGYLSASEFFAMRDLFFENCEESVRGWERAVDAQTRIASATAAYLDGIDGPGDVLLVGHGGVGTLLYCHLAKTPIAVEHDQPAGGGHYFSFDRDTLAVAHDWLAMEDNPERAAG